MRGQYPATRKHDSAESLVGAGQFASPAGQVPKEQVGKDKAASNILFRSVKILRYCMECTALVARSTPSPGSLCVNVDNSTEFRRDARALKREEVWSNTGVMFQV